MFRGMILTVQGMRYKVIAVRPNGKVTMKPVGLVQPRRVVKARKVMSDQGVLKAFDKQMAKKKEIEGQKKVEKSS